MWKVVGHSRAIKFLDTSTDVNMLSHAYLFLGPPNIGKNTLAINLAQKVNCSSIDSPCQECQSCIRIQNGNHADVLAISMDSVGAKAEIGIDVIREMQHKAMFKPYEGTRRVVIIKEAEKLSIEAANCLLKTLEEPPSELLMVLTSTSKDLLPPTLCSRCKEINMNPLSEDEVSIALEAHKSEDTEIPALLSKICQGRVGWAIQAIQQPEVLENRRETLDHVKNLSKRGIAHKIDYASELAELYSENRSSLIQTFRWIISFWRDIILIKCGAPDAIRNHDVKKMLIDQSKDYAMQELISAIKSTTHTMELLNANANPRLVIEHLFLTLKNNTMTSLK